jgi:hypothetical protein
MIDSGSIVIRLANDDDKLDVCNLLKLLGLQIPDDPVQIDSLWNKLWNDNPFYKYFDVPITYGWVMVHDKKIVGFFGSIPRVYQWNNELIPVSIAGLWGVQKEFRHCTHLLCNKFFNDNPIDLKLVTTAIKPTGRIFEKYNGQKVPLPQLDIVQMIPINLSKLLHFKLSSRRLFMPLVILSGLLNRIWKLQFYILKKNKYIEEISLDNLPETTDSFLAKLDNDTDGIIAHRNKEIFQWFYKSNAKNYKFRLFFYIKDNNTLGYISMLTESINNSTVIQRCKIIDLVGVDDQIKKSLVKEVLRISFKSNLDLIEIHLGGMIKREHIPGIAFQRKYTNFPLYYQTNDAILNQNLQKNDSWNIMSFDGDTCLG